MQVNDLSDLPQNLVVVIYKGKILLSSKDSFINLREKNVWSLPDKSRTREFGPTTAGMESFDRQLHYIKLTDKNVFAIRRQDGRRLEFYGPREFGSLLLTPDTRLLYYHYKEEIEKLLTDIH